MNYELLDAAMSFRRLLKGATEKEIDEVFQRIATIANDSEYAATHEPMQGLCESMTAELKQRALLFREEFENQEFDNEDGP